MFAVGLDVDTVVFTELNHTTTRSASMEFVVGDSEKKNLAIC